MMQAGTPQPGQFVPVDQAARDLAVRTQDRAVLVEAGAGTGKTTLLVDRLLYAIETGAARMQDIVAISFTEKAAAELRLRLRQELEKRQSALAEGADSAAPRWRAALRDLGRAQVSTIHAFASALLHEHPMEARLEPQFRVLDEMEALHLQRAFWSRWLDEQLSDTAHAPALGAMLLAGVQLEPDLASLARALYDNRDVAEEVPLPQVPADLEPRMREFAGAARACLAHAEATCHDPNDRGFEHVREWVGAFDALEDLQTSSWPAMFLQCTRPKAHLGQRDAWRPGAAEHNKHLRRQLAEQLAVVQQAIADRILRHALVWLQRYRDDYEQEKKRLGVLDFQDLLLHARRLVRDDLRVRRDIAVEIGMLCVDEFQDTDPLQAELVLFLAEAGPPAVRWTDVHLGPKLFLVGDPKQSIYRFRRADLDVYARCRDLVRASGGLVLEIAQNFRSRPAVLHWVNGVFEHLFPRQAESAEPSHVALVPRPDALSTPAVWVLRGAPALGGTSSGAEQYRRAEAQAVAQFIYMMIREPFAVRDGGAVRAIRPGDIALLFGRTSGIEIYEEALRRAALPFRQEGGKLFFQRQEVRDILQALAACDDPHDELSVVAALRSPLFGTTDEELYLHRLRAGSFRYDAGDVTTPLDEALAILRQLHAERHDHGVAGTIEHLLARTHARAVYGAQPHGERARNNFDALVRQARAFERSHSLGLREFVRFFRELDEDTPRLAEWAPDEQESDQVRLLTVHMAKGLEFPCVILVNLEARGQLRPEPLVFDRRARRAEVRLEASDVRARLATIGFAEVAEAEQKRQEAEDRRLLYVAATRARDYLVLGDFRGAKPEGYLQALASVPGACGEASFGALGAPRRVVEASPSMLQGNDSWCVLHAAALPAVPRRMLASDKGTDVVRRLSERQAWRLAHARRVQEAARRATRVREAPVGQTHAPAAARSRRLEDAVRLVLAQVGPATVFDDVERLVHEAAERTGARDVDKAVRALVHPVWERIAARTRGARRVWRDVSWTSCHGRHVLECRLDLVLHGDDGYTVIGYDVRPYGPELAVVESRAQAHRALAVVAAGYEVAEVGSFFLADGTYIVLGDLAAHVAALRAELDALGNDSTTSRIN